jgi:hypothetical protein
MYKSRRQRRYENLKTAGFLPFEAVGLSKIAVNRMPPYMRQMIQDRSKEVIKAKKDGWSKQKFVDEIKGKYHDKRWAIRTKKGNIHSNSVFSLLRDYEDAYRVKNPDYVSPWENRNKQYDTAIKKASKTVRQREKQYLITLEKELALAKQHNNQQQIDIIQSQIDNIKNWSKD